MTCACISDDEGCVHATRDRGNRESDGLADRSHATLHAASSDALSRPSIYARQTSATLAITLREIWIMRLAYCVHDRLQFWFLICA